MLFSFDERLSDSPLVERIWRTESGRDGYFTSVAASNWEMVVTRHNGKTNLTVRGPETKATPAYCPADAEFFGIIFKLGAFMPPLPPGIVRDRNDRVLPGATTRSFWLNGSAWQFPNYDNADTFVGRLVRDGLLMYDDVVGDVLRGFPFELSIRSVRRRFLRATGLTQGYIRQIERARRAMTLLQQGTSILDTVFEAGYFDQAHLTRSLKHFTGQTPAQVVSVYKVKPTSVLYDTELVG